MQPAVSSMTFSMAMVGSEVFAWQALGLAALCSKVNSGACSCARRSSLTATLRAQTNMSSGPLHSSCSMIISMLSYPQEHLPLSTLGGALQPRPKRRCSHYTMALPYNAGP